MKQNLIISKDELLCSRCSGSGFLNSYSYVAGGLCFKCQGAGKIKKVVKGTEFTEEELQLIKDLLNKAYKEGVAHMEYCGGKNRLEYYPQERKIVYKDYHVDTCNRKEMYEQFTQYLDKPINKYIGFKVQEYLKYTIKGEKLKPYTKRVSI